MSFDNKELREKLGISFGSGNFISAKISYKHLCFEQLLYLPRLLKIFQNPLEIDWKRNTLTL